jgi:mersacidin/lichenicidin family type 2 lantibiotic
MSSDHIIKAWKDQDFRASLNEAIPANPAGLIELTDEALDELVAGAAEAGSCCWSSCNTKEVKEPTTEEVR